MFSQLDHNASLAVRHLLRGICSRQSYVSFVAVSEVKAKVWNMYKAVITLVTDAAHGGSEPALRWRCLCIKRCGSCWSCHRRQRLTNHRLCHWGNLSRDSSRTHTHTSSDWQADSSAMCVSCGLRVWESSSLRTCFRSLRSLPKKIIIRIQGSSPLILPSLGMDCFGKLHIVRYSNKFNKSRRYDCARWHLKSAN